MNLPSLPLRTWSFARVADAWAPWPADAGSACTPTAPTTTTTSSKPILLMRRGFHRRRRHKHGAGAAEVADRGQAGLDLPRRNRAPSARAATQARRAPAARADELVLDPAGDPRRPGALRRSGGGRAARLPAEPRAPPA